MKRRIWIVASETITRYSLVELHSNTRIRIEHRYTLVRVIKRLAIWKWTDLPFARKIVATVHLSIYGNATASDCKMYLFLDLFVNVCYDQYPRLEIGHAREVNGNLKMQCAEPGCGAFQRYTAHINLLRQRQIVLSEHNSGT